jgi:L-fucose isomerase-like protein
MMHTNTTHSQQIPRLGFLPIARPTFDVPFAEALTAQARAQLTEARFDLVGPDALVMSADAVNAAVAQFCQQPPDLIVVLQASFADSTMVATVAEALGVPLLLWGLPEDRVGGRLRLNSFCGINLAAHGLRRAGYGYEYLYAAPGDPAVIDKVRAVSTAAMVRRRLRGLKIGRVGENPAGFDTCLVDYAALQSRLGVEIAQIELPEVFSGARAADPDAVSAVAERVKAQVAGVDALDQQQTRGTLATYLTLRQIAAQRGVAGLAVRCWPEFFTDLGCSACGAMSLLSNEQTPSSCEADVNGTITQVILQWISGEPAFGTDMVSFDAVQDVAVLWHCGLAPLSMADPATQPRATIHSNRKMPLLMEFTLKPGRVTVARLSEATGSFRLVIGTGEMISAPPSFTGTSGTVRFDSGTQAVMDTILREGLEHHLSITYGDHTTVLLALADMLRIPVLRL